MTGPGLGLVTFGGLAGLLREVGCELARAPGEADVVVSAGSSYKERGVWRIHAGASAPKEETGYAVEFRLAVASPRSGKRFLEIVASGEPPAHAQKEVPTGAWITPTGVAEEQARGSLREQGFASQLKGAVRRALAENAAR